MVKFELLPNEILFLCFKYLHAFEIFYSFDQLNYRFNQLIRNIPLHLKYLHTQKLLFDKFCQKMLSNPELKEQIYSLDISNENSCRQIGIFLSWFSLDEFPYLKAISLGHVQLDDVVKLTSVLPLISELTDFRSIAFADPDAEVLSTVPLYQLQRLSVHSGLHDVIIFDEPSIVIYLTISCCSLHTVFNMLKNVLLLKYLNIHDISDNNYELSVDSLETFQLVHLKRMLLTGFECTFDNLEVIMRHTPNLQHFTITSQDDIEMIDASRWKRLITSSIPRLNRFNFEFNYTRQQNVLEEFKRFQSDFWLKEHQWYTDYGLNHHYAIIYTIPSIQDEYSLGLHPIECKLKQLNKFDNTKKLCLCYESMTNQYGYYFPNVTSLILRRHLTNSNIPSSAQILEFLPSIINLSNLEYLSISHPSMEDLIIILLEILTQATKLSTLSMQYFDVKLFFKNKEISKYFNRMIRKLDEDYYELRTLDEVQQFCEIFFNIEQFKYRIYEREHLVYLLNNLLHLSLLEIILPDYDNSESFLGWFEEQTFNSNMIFHIEELLIPVIIDPTNFTPKHFCIWIDRNFNKTSL